MSVDRVAIAVGAECSRESCELLNREELPLQPLQTHIEKNLVLVQIHFCARELGKEGIWAE